MNETNTPPQPQPLGIPLNQLVYRPHMSGKPRFYHHLFCHLDENHLFTSYLPEFDPYFSASSTSTNYETTIWHCDENCFYLYSESLAAELNREEFREDHIYTFDTLPPLACFIFFPNPILRSLSTIWFPCPYCVLRLVYSNRFTISASNISAFINFNNHSSDNDDNEIFNLTESTITTIVGTLANGFNLV